MAHSWEVRDEWVKPVPESWEKRLREISPVLDRTSHLRFRWRQATEQWELYECTPAILLSDGRVKQLTQHWSELPKSQQGGRKLFVSEYQHYMFRTHRVEASRFWVLQGDHGGTPACYTEREERMLKAMNEPTEVPPPGLLPFAPFDERAVRAIQARDRLIKYDMNLDRMFKACDSEEQQREAEETEKDFRRTFLKWWREEMAPMSEFMKWYLRTSESDQTLPKATPEMANAVTQWKDHYIETGALLNAHTASSTKHSVAVA